MKPERIALGLSLAACLALVAWNVRLQMQIADLQTDQPVVTEEVAQNTANTDVPQQMQQRRGPEGMQAGGGWSRGGSAGRGEVVEVGSNSEAKSETQQEPRRERDWEAFRVDMETATIDTVEAFGQQNQWSAELTEEVLALYLDSGERIGAIWSEMGDGESTHYQARKRMREVQDDVSELMDELVGTETHEELEEHLFESRRDVWRRTQPSSSN